MDAYEDEIAAQLTSQVATEDHLLAFSDRGDLAHTFVVERFLGQGAFGRVFQVRDTKGHRSIVKEYTSDHRSHENELRTLQQLSDRCRPYFVCLEGVFRDALGRRLLQFEFIAENMVELQAAIVRNHWSSHTKARVALDVLRAVAALHRLRVAHRDLKPSNILVASDGSRVQLIDFGLSCVSPESPFCTGKGGTVAFSPPESFLDPDVTSHVGVVRSLAQDVWSTGLVLALLFVGGETKSMEILGFFARMSPAHIAEELSLLTQAELDRTLRRQWSRSIPRDWLRVLHSMLQVNPLKRITIHGALRAAEACVPNIGSQTQDDDVRFRRVFHVTRPALAYATLRDDEWTRLVSQRRRRIIVGS